MEGTNGSHNNMKINGYIYQSPNLLLLQGLEFHKQQEHASLRIRVVLLQKWPKLFQTVSFPYRLKCSELKE